MRALRLVLACLVLAGCQVEAQIVSSPTTSTTVTPSTFAALGTPASGTIRYCSDCDPLAVLTCTSLATKTGALAIRLNGAWICVGA